MVLGETFFGKLQPFFKHVQFFTGVNMYLMLKKIVVMISFSSDTLNDCAELL